MWGSNVQQEKHTQKCNKRQETCMRTHQNYVQRNAIHRKYGTHIGVSLRQMNLRNPVTSPDPTLPVLDVHHQRYNRVLLTDTHMRKHLSYLSRKYLRKLRPEEHLDSNIEAERTREFQQNLGAHCDQPVENFILALVQRSEDQEILYYIARILCMLSGDAAMDAVFPFVCHDLLNTCITDVCQNTFGVQCMEKLKHDRGIDIVKSLELCIKHGCIPLVTKFWKYVQKKVERLHKDNNRPAPPVARIPITYDPSYGSAYYFSEHGAQIRKMPEYRLSSWITTANYDEQPVLDGVCNKKKPYCRFWISIPVVLSHPWACTWISPQTRW